jgi:hypothetical protein
VSATGQFKTRKGYKIGGVGGYGVNLNKAVDFVQNATPQDKTKFMALARKCISLIFGHFPSDKPVRSEYRIRVKKNINELLNAIESGDANAAASAYSVANFNYYMAKKHDDGVLFVNLYQKTFVWYGSAEELTSKGLRLHSDTISISATKDVGRAVYPQMYVNPTTFGGDQAEKQLKKLKFGKKTDELQFQQAMVDWVSQLAAKRGIRNQRLITAMGKEAAELRKTGVSTADVIANLEQKYPQLAVPKPRDIPTPQPLRQEPEAGKVPAEQEPQPAV